MEPLHSQDTPGSLEEAVADVEPVVENNKAKWKDGTVLICTLLGTC